MWKYLLALSLLSAVSTSSACAQEAKQDFVLVNRTGYDISEVYLSASQADSWEDDLLADEDDNFRDDEAKTIHFKPRVRTCLWDLKVVYDEDDSSAVWHDINLCTVSKITLIYNAKSGETKAILD
jgi:hypothetical protein